VNLILLEPDELDGDVIHLGGRRGRHIAAVIRPAVGDRLRAGVVRGGRGWGRVVGVRDEVVEISIESMGAPEPAPPTSLIVAVPRPKVIPRLVAAVASLGVSRLDLTRSWRVEKSYLGSPALSPAALEAAARAGCEQGATTWLPEIQVHPRLMGLLDAIDPQAAPGSRLAIAHPKAEREIEDELAGIAGTPLTLALGPEGGWIEREVETFAERGFTPVRSGEAIMKVEVAAAALLGQIALLRRI
jgi:RsmE family RNA methyltransferase